MASYLDLLKELGIEVSTEQWNAAHTDDTRHYISPPPSPPPLLPTKPALGYIDGHPIFTRSQIDQASPEVFGFQFYDVVEDEPAAHPWVLSYDDEQYYRANYRPIHRYSRSYRLRWTLAHVVGHVGQAPDTVLNVVRTALAAQPSRIHCRGAHDFVRTQLKTLPHGSKYFLSIPWIIRRCGGPRWQISDRVYMDVLRDAEGLHRAFDNLRQQGVLEKRRRFPKMEYVLLRLLDFHGVSSPYKVPWARTSIKRRQLAVLVSSLANPPCLTATPSADHRHPVVACPTP
jgi:hypothetical protein